MVMSNKFIFPALGMFERKFGLLLIPEQKDFCFLAENGCYRSSSKTSKLEAFAHKLCECQQKPNEAQNEKFRHKK